MAEIDSGGGGKKKGPKKASTKVDMTPMVDLAFLLITFFMLTTTFSKPQMMEVNMPDKGDDQPPMKTKKSTTLTVILGKGDKVNYFQGIANEQPRPDVLTTSFSEDGGIRKVLLQKKAEIKQTNREDMVVIIKAQDESNYKNVVDILDEMAITGVTRYALVDISKDEVDLLKEKNLY